MRSPESELGGGVKPITYRVGDLAPPPLPTRSETEVMARWRGERPIVSILCITYQHVNFIEDALRGFLGQDTDFPFEIIVRDDASTDGTAEIVRDYSQRFPNVVRAVLESENQWPEVQPLQALAPMVRGQFVAMCEGDDYWIDDQHLNSSVKCLGADSRASATVATYVVIHDGRVIGIQRPRRRERWQWKLPIRVLVHRSSILIPDLQGVSGDMQLAAALQRAGPVAIAATEPMAVYRIHDGGVYSGPRLAAQRSRLSGYLGGATQLLSIAFQLDASGEAGLARKYRNGALTVILESLAVEVLLRLRLGGAEATLRRFVGWMLRRITPTSRPPRRRD